jgi:hypothetical protein
MPDVDALRAEYARRKEETTRLAGPLEDIPRRAALLHGLFLDSGGNHVFPLIAAHGALWAYRYFEVGGSLGRLIARRYFYSEKERAYRLGILQEFAEGFRRVNRQVCIDTWTNFHFTREHGRERGAAEVVPPPLLEALNTVHAARAAGRSLSATERRHVFTQSFEWEQELTVAPGVKTAVEQFQCFFMRTLCLKPLVRFAYFPRLQFLLFHNFADKAERIAKGMRAYDLARRAGWPKVKESLRTYGLLPDGFVQSPREYLDRCQPTPAPEGCADRETDGAAGPGRVPSIGC